MNEYEDEDHSYDESEESDLTVRELRAEIVRLEAQLDQLTASVRERAREAAEVRARLAELEEGLERLKARRQLDEKLFLFLWVMTVLSLAMWLYTIFTT